ncbi:hypothetical protein [Frankia sp. AiPs1]|nr:hypothetical protein [Frankia sp. AiPs1]
MTIATQSLTILLVGTADGKRLIHPDFFLTGAVPRNREVTMD